jgi:hypothetical protein
MCRRPNRRAIELGAMKHALICSAGGAACARSCARLTKVGSEYHSTVLGALYIHAHKHAQYAWRQKRSRITAAVQHAGT